MLVGIARLAAESPLLEAKSQVEYFEIQARSILNRTRPGMPFAWTINPYRGCEFGCKYCYARYTHEFMGMEESTDFEDKIYAKKASAELLRHELKKIPKRDGIAIGTATDPYQPAERRYERTRAILEVFAGERGRRLSITTKSDLVTRDIDLHREIARGNVLDINVTITTLDTELARMLEPRAPRPDLRLARGAQAFRGGDLRGRVPESGDAADHRSRRGFGFTGARGGRSGRQILRRRRAFSDAERAESFLSFPAGAIPATCRAVSRTVREEPVPGRGLQRPAARQGTEDPREIRAGCGAGRV